MPKRKATKAELESGIGEQEIDLDEFEEAESDDEERFTGFAQDEESDIDDEVLIKEYEECLKQAEKEGE